MKQVPKEPLLIDHSSIIDGFGELTEHKQYKPFNSYCGICDQNVYVTSAIQKYIVEINKVPVKMLRRGAIFCENCKTRRAKINYLKNGNKYLEVEEGKTELINLRKEEQEIKSQSKGLYESGEWPY